MTTEWAAQADGMKTRQARRPMRYKPLLISTAEFLIEDRGKRGLLLAPAAPEAGKAGMGLFPSFGPLSLCACMHIIRPECQARRGFLGPVPSAISHCVSRLSVSIWS